MDIYITAYATCLEKVTPAVARRVAADGVFEKAYVLPLDPKPQ